MKFYLSIIIPAYSEESNLKILYKDLITNISKITENYEIILVDDGSRDNTWNEVVNLNSLDSRVKGIKFTRNFGHQYALLAGISKSKGDAIITLDADLQHPPDLIPRLIEEWEKGYKIVNTVRIDDNNLNYFKKFTSNLFYKLFSFLSGVELKKGMADFRLIDKKVAEELINLNEAGFFLRGLIVWLGYKSTDIEYHSRNRHGGKSKYNISKMLKLAFSGITSFSLVPLRIGILLGLFTSILSFMELIFVIYTKFYTSYVVPGWASAVGIVSFLFGVLFILIGLIGEYIGRTYIESQRRPRFIVDDTVGLEVK